MKSRGRVVFLETSKHRGESLGGGVERGSGNRQATSYAAREVKGLDELSSTERLPTCFVANQRLELLRDIGVLNGFLRKTVQTEDLWQL
jgi:hypothetical protein